jgi:two-component system sensor histidine kinase RpfC
LGIANPAEAVAWLRARLRSRPDSEHEQAILRIVIVTIVLVAMAFAYTDDTRHGSLLFYGLIVDLVFALLLFVAICVSPAANVQRRLIGSVADNGTATFVMFMTGQAGFSMIGVYLFVAFGNGFRYGRRYLFISQALALVGYVAVLLFHAYWAEFQAAGWSLFVALVVLPVYVSTLLERIHDAQRRAEEANLAKSSFLANMSHEMRTPLNGIVGVADLIKATPLDAQQSELVRLLSHSTMLLRSLVDDVLDISKIEAGHLAIEISEFDLHATLNGVVHLLRPHAESKGLALRAMIDPAIDYTLRGDQHHLRQVLLNLMSNAVKFTHRGEINVDVTLTGETDDGLGVRFEVRDTGIGIAPEAQLRIFEAFVQADESTTRRFGGTGLGTTIAKQLVELMGGTIGLESTVGEGSLFWFELPLLKAKQALAADVAEGSAKSAGLVVGEARASGPVAGMMAKAVGAVASVSTIRDAVEHLRDMKSKGVNVSAIVVSGGVEEAARAFEELDAVRKDPGVALIYCSADPASARKEPALRRIAGLQVVGKEATQRHLRNAIHAATTRDLGESGEVIDLASVLQQQRQPVRILVAEDNATNLAILRQLLESAGHKVYAAMDGEEALDIYEAESPELAILDFNMPERNGVEVAATIRTLEPAGVRLPVIILSAAVTVEARERARLAGADEFVGKPFNAATLLQIVDRLARRAGRTGAVPAVPAVAVAARPQPALDAVALMDADRFGEVERIASTPDFLNQLLRGFQDDVELLLRKLDAAIGSGQVSAVHDTLHALKGAAVSVGASQLAARCKAMEELAKSGQMAHVLAASPALRQCFDGTLRAIAALSERRHRASL